MRIFFTPTSSQFSWPIAYLAAVLITDSRTKAISDKLIFRPGYKPGRAGGALPGFQTENDYSGPYKICINKL